MTIFYSLITHQGTAAGETGLCEHCIDDEAKAHILAFVDEDCDVERGFVDVTGNDAVECSVCRRLPAEDG